MKKIALVGSFCNTEEKVSTLLDNINKLKSLGVDVMVISPITLPKEVLDSCDYFFLTKENPILNFPVKSIDMWRIVGNPEGPMKIAFSTMDYGWAGLYQIKKLSDIALSLDYDHFYHMIYDLVIDDFVVGEISSQKPFSFYPFIKYPHGHLFGFGLYFMSLSRENLSKICPFISLENYLADQNNCAESFLHKIVLNLEGATVEKEPVSDSINYWDDVDLFNHSPSNKIKFFISKHYYSNLSTKILFYDVQTPTEVEIKVNGELRRIQIQNSELVDLNIYGNVDGEVEIKIEDEVHDVAPFINSLINTYIQPL